VKKQWHNIVVLLYAFQGMAPSSGLLEFYYTYSFTVFFQIVSLQDVKSHSLVGGDQDRGGTLCFHTQGPPVAVSLSTGFVSTYKTARCHNLEYHNSETHP
jgi:hypothetical protein